MGRSRTEPATTPASGEAPASTAVRARLPPEREPAAERAAAGDSRGAGLLTGGHAGRKCPILERALHRLPRKATSESSVS
jgi:hypothetical protein